MKIITKQPGAKAEVRDLPKLGLEVLQGLVGGYVEAPCVPPLREANIVLWANEEGLIISMKPNLVFFEEGWDDIMGIVGPIVLTGQNEEGETVGLTDEQVKLALPILEAAQQKLAEFLRK